MIGEQIHSKIVGVARFAMALVCVVVIFAVLAKHGAEHRLATEHAPAIQSYPVYPHSVVPGGVHSMQDFLDASTKDPVVWKHYQDFDLSRMVVTRGYAIRGYVSYRMGDKIYWTRNPVSIPNREIFLVSSDMVIRARCGNRVSLKPMQPTRPDEPTDLDTPSVPYAPPSKETPTDDSSFAFSPWPSPLPPVQTTPGILPLPPTAFIPPVASCVACSAVPPPAAPVPEPGTGYLLAFGVAGMVAFGAVCAFLERRKGCRPNVHVCGAAGEQPIALWCIHKIIANRRRAKSAKPEHLVGEMNAVVELHLLLEEMGGKESESYEDVTAGNEQGF